MKHEFLKTLKKASILWVEERILLNFTAWCRERQSSHTWAHEFVCIHAQRPKFRDSYRLWIQFSCLAHECPTIQPRSSAWSGRFCRQSSSFLPFWGIVLASIIYLFLPLSFVSPLTSELTTTRLVSVPSVVATGRTFLWGQFSSVFAWMKPEHVQVISVCSKGNLKNIFHRADCGTAPHSPALPPALSAETGHEFRARLFQRSPKRNESGVESLQDRRETRGTGRVYL